jgi:hypothetical protein
MQPPAGACQCLVHATAPPPRCDLMLLAIARPKLPSMASSSSGQEHQRGPADSERLRGAKEPFEVAPGWVIAAVGLAANLATIVTEVREEPLAAGALAVLAASSGIALALQQSKLRRLTGIILVFAAAFSLAMSLHAIPTSTDDEDIAGDEVTASTQGVEINPRSEVECRGAEITGIASRHDDDQVWVALRNTQDALLRWYLKKAEWRAEDSNEWILKTSVGSSGNGGDLYVFTAFTLDRRDSDFLAGLSTHSRERIGGGFYSTSLPHGMEDSPPEMTATRQVETSDDCSD